MYIHLYIYISVYVYVYTYHGSLKNIWLEHGRRMNYAEFPSFFVLGLEDGHVPPV